MAGLPASPPSIRVLIARSRAFAVLPFVRPVLQWRRLPQTYGTGATASARWFAFLRLTFIICVLLPTLATAVYSALMTSYVYTSEARLAIRESTGERSMRELDEGSGKGSDSSGSSVSGAVTGMTSAVSNVLGNTAGAAHTQAPFLMVNYVTSLDYVSQLDKNGWLRHFFTRAGIDPLSALRADATLEELWRYWNQHLTIAVDRRSGILIINVRAFSPKEARTLAERIIRDGELLLNEVMIRARADSVRNAEAQLEQAQERFADALTRQQEWRVRRRAVDPLQAADALGITLVRLEKERIAADREIRSLQRLGASNAPALGILRDRVKAIDSEIAQFQAKLADTRSKNSAAEALAAFEESELEVRFAETLQSIAVAGRQEAERRAQAQSAFVNVFVPPDLPSSPSGPFWWRTTLLVFTLSLVLWINVMILVAVIRDHMR